MNLWEIAVPPCLTNKWTLAENVALIGTANRKWMITKLGTKTVRSPNLVPKRLPLYDNEQVFVMFLEQLITAGHPFCDYR
jgi:hypothetical protein